MATGLFGVSWTEIIDFLLKLAPAASIVGGILAARVLAQSGHQSRRMYASLQQQTLVGATVTSALCPTTDLSIATQQQHRHSTSAKSACS